MLRCERRLDGGPVAARTTNASAAGTAAERDGEAGFEPGQPAAAYRHGIGLARGELDDTGVARALKAGDAVEGDDVAAVDAHEAGGIEALLHDPDGERAEELGL